MDVSGQLHAPTALSPEKEPQKIDRRLGLDAAEKWKRFYLCRESNSNLSAVQPVTHGCTS
jgi:hypothetical protein